MFGWHPLTDPTADHRDPAQWQFYVVPETALPQQKSISLAALQRMASAVSCEDLGEAVRQCVKVHGDNYRIRKR